MQHTHARELNMRTIGWLAAAVSSSVTKWPFSYLEDFLVGEFLVPEAEYVADGLGASAVVV